MNSRQRRKLRRLREGAFGNHVGYVIAWTLGDSDDIKNCETCGNYTTGRLCRSCAEQEMIDADPLSEDDIRYQYGKYY